MTSKKFLTFLVSLFCLNAIGQKDFQKALQTELIMAEDGELIELEAGHYMINSTLSIEGKKNIKIIGKGMDKTILDFANQTDGAEGLRVSNMENMTIQNLTVKNAKGDDIKAMNVKNITFKNVETSWDGKPKSSNGAYGLYPVMCDGVMIDGCVAIGASDAGIYVGQSKNIIVKNSKAINNVAGIEIENSINAEVFDNEAYGNTGGVLVFDLPDLVQKKGGNVKVYNNYIHDNNFKNFAPKGNIVGKVPPGTGVLILATSDVEVFENRIINNQTMGTGVISYYLTENPIKDKEYYPYPTNIAIHNNIYERKATKTTSKGRFGKMYRLVIKFGKDVPHIQWDGIKDLDNDATVLCIKDNKNQSFANLDAENDFKNISRDVDIHRCD